MYGESETGTGVWGFSQAGNGVKEKAPQKAALVYLVEPRLRERGASLVMLMLSMEEACTEKAKLERVCGALYCARDKMKILRTSGKS